MSDRYFDHCSVIQNDCHIKKNTNDRGSSKKTLLKYQDYPSITNIKDIMKSENFSSFSFQPVVIDKVKDITETLNTKKVCLDSDMLVKLINMNEDIFSRLIFQHLNQSEMSMVNFPTV